MIKITRTSSDSASKSTHKYKTVKGARKFADEWLGSNFEISESFGYAISGDGITKLTIEGATWGELYPEAPGTPVDDGAWAAGLVPLGDRLGSVLFPGRCPDCRRQHMSTHALVGPRGECAACYSRARARSCAEGEEGPCEEARPEALRREGARAARVPALHECPRCKTTERADDEGELDEIFGFRKMRLPARKGERLVKIEGELDGEPAVWYELHDADGNVRAPRTVRKVQSYCRECRSIAAREKRAARAAKGK